MKLDKALKIAQINNCALRRASWTPNCYIYKSVGSKHGLCHNDENNMVITDYLIDAINDGECDDWEIVSDRKFEQVDPSLEILEVF